MSDEERIHENRLVLGVTAVLIIGFSMLLLQLVAWLSSQAPGANFYPLSIYELSIASVVAWPAIYLLGWFLNDGLPKLNRKFEQW